MTATTFRALNLHERTLTAVDAAGYDTPTEVQHRAIPELLAGRDVLATAQTGTGKTAAFVLPIFQRVPRRRSGSGVPSPSVLIVTPTRELAAQITESVGVYGAGSGFSAVAVYGGASKNRQISQLRSRPQVVVATPGRLLDLLSEGELALDSVTYLVLDEADRMLDMGFIPDVRKIVSMVGVPRQTALFSATMPPAILNLANDFLDRPVRVEAESGELRIERIAQSVMYVPQANKLELLAGLIRDRGMYKVLVFTRTKHRASKVAKVLAKQRLTADAIHGDKSQNARTRALNSFKKGAIQVLVATDVASRGIDVDDVTHVVNFEIPNEPETYVHRIGRTARAGADGVAISLCDTSEMTYIRDIERLLGASIDVDRKQPFHEDRPSPRTKVGTKGGNSARPAPRGRRATQSTRPAGEGRPHDRANTRSGERSRDYGVRSESASRRGASRRPGGTNRTGSKR